MGKKCIMTLLCIVHVVLFELLMYPFVMTIDSGVSFTTASDNLDYLTNTPVYNLGCMQICSDLLVYEDGTNCCTNPFVTKFRKCQDKSVCYQEKLVYVQNEFDSSKGYFIKWLLILLAATIVYFIIVYKICKWSKRWATNYMNPNNAINAPNLNNPRNAPNAAIDPVLADQLFQMFRPNRQIPQPARQPLLAESFIAEEREDQCIICLMEFQQSRVVELGCRHKFHRECIQRWRQQSIKCPICCRPQI